MTRAVTVRRRLSSLSAELRSSLSIPGLHVTDRVTEMDFMMLLHVKCTSGDNLTEPESNTCAHTPLNSTVTLEEEKKTKSLFFFSLPFLCS